MIDPDCVALMRAEEEGMHIVMRDRIFAAWIAAGYEVAAALPEPVKWIGILAQPESPKCEQPEWGRMSIDMVDRRGRFTEEEFGQLSNPAKAHIEHAPYWTKVEGVYRNTSQVE